MVGVKVVSDELETIARQLVLVSSASNSDRKLEHVLLFLAPVPYVTQAGLLTLLSKMHVYSSTKVTKSTSGVAFPSLHLVSFADRQTWREDAAAAARTVH